MMGTRVSTAYQEMTTTDRRGFIRLAGMAMMGLGLAAVSGCSSEDESAQTGSPDQDMTQAEGVAQPGPTDAGSAEAVDPADIEYSETLEFGNYDIYDPNASAGSSASGDLGSDGKYYHHPLEWIVLERRADGSVLLLSKYQIRDMPYNDEDAEVTWETCALRSWLNSEFLSSAFTDEERGRIALTDITTEPNPTYGTEAGADTQDRVFLLSYEEVHALFGLTAVDRGNEAAIAEVYGGRNGSSSWWLRTPGGTGRYAGTVEYDGHFNNYGELVNEEGVAVRPALVLNP